MPIFRKKLLAIAVLFSFIFCGVDLRGSGPQTICYSVAPNPYLDAHAAEIKKIYDGFFFVVGGWENLTKRFVGDAVTVQLGGQTVFDAQPPSGHGVLYRDKYRFEKRVPITLPAGSTRLNVVSVNYWGSWEFTLRITDENGLPIPGVRFHLQ